MSLTSANSYSFLIESSHIPIYQRIIESLAKTLIEMGHTVLLMSSNQFDRDEEFLYVIDQQEPDYYILSNPLCRLAKHIEDQGIFLFEATHIPLIFIHHDSPFFTLRSTPKIQNQIRAFQETSDRSFHFCLEPSDVIDLQILGIQHVFPIFHASEFQLPQKPPESCYDASFPIIQRYNQISPLSVKRRLSPMQFLRR